MLYLKNVSNSNNALWYCEGLSQKESVLRINSSICDGDKIEVMRPLSYFALLYQIESIKDRRVKLIGYTEPSNLWELSKNPSNIDDISQVRARTMRDAVIQYVGDSGVAYVTHDLVGEFTVWQKFSVVNGVVKHDGKISE